MLVTVHVDVQQYDRCKVDGQELYLLLEVDQCEPIGKLNKLSSAQILGSILLEVKDPRKEEVLASLG